MTLYAVSLSFALTVDAADPPELTRELAIHLVFADTESQAREKGAEIGRNRETVYFNGYGETVRDRFHGVVAVQELLAREISDGMEVCYWLYEGPQLVLENGAEAPPSTPGG